MIDWKKEDREVLLVDDVIVYNNEASEHTEWGSTRQVQTTIKCNQRTEVLQEVNEFIRVWDQRTIKVALLKKNSKGFLCNERWEIPLMHFQQVRS